MKHEKLVLVSGDCVCDHNVYMGKRPKANSPQSPGVRTRESCGGALLLKNLIAAVIADPDVKKAEADKTEPDAWRVVFNAGQDLKKLPSHYHAFCLWEPQVVDPGNKDSEVWRAVEPPLGYGQKDEKAAVRTCRKRCGGSSGPGKAASSENPAIVVIDDAGLGFRQASAQNQWPACLRAKQQAEPRWVVLKLSGSIGEGALWQKLVENCKDNLIVVVSADELRSAEVRISRGLSWEATVEDLLIELEGNPALHPLLEAKHLIVTFRSDGAFWLDNRGIDNKRTSMLVFDAAMAEGEWAENQGKGTNYGFMSCFVAAVVRELSRDLGTEHPDFEGALIAGLRASRELLRIGHGRVKIEDKRTPGRMIENPNPGFPFETIAESINKPKHRKDLFVSARAPGRLQDRGNWMMLDEWQVHARGLKSQQPHYLAAQAVAVLGPGALVRFPVAQFGGLQTIDRKEIESLRTIRQLIRDYENGRPQRRPLSLGVFGPPGAGKSFGVEQIAKAVLGKNVSFKTFNLSQFRDPEEIVSALHQVRDLALTGTTPVIFWDEFDANEYEWLQYLLAPMQDGAFQDGPITHPIGMSIFVFAGATSQTYETFGPLNPDELPEYQAEKLRQDQKDKKSELERIWHQFVLRKGPDFKSRLAGFLNVLGPNPRQDSKVIDGQRLWQDAEDDFCCPIRRALFIRVQFGLKDGQRLQLDRGVLRAMLEVPHYKAGARSLVFICQHLKHSMSDIPSRSDLPGWQLLNMHVDAARFWEICERDQQFRPMGPALASALHEAYRLRIRGKVEKKNLDVPLEELPEDKKAANIAQALRIPENLRLLNLCLIPGAKVAAKDLVSARTKEEAHLRDLIAKPENVELLAEAEHNGWMIERMLDGWTYSRTRNDHEKKHDLLIPYSQLTEEHKDYDRETIRGKEPPPGKPHEEQFGYVDILKIAGFRVAKMKSKE